jgi:DNA-binding NarL/FixJ family response regulator
MLEDFSRQLAHPETAHDHQTQKNILSEREQEVLGLVAEGLPNKAIAQRLNISPATVNYHLTSVFNKLGVHSRAQAVALAFQRGLVAADDTQLTADF